MAIEITVNEQVHQVDAAPDTPLLYVLMNELDLRGPRFGCGLAQCGSCSVLVDGVETRSCITPLSAIGTKSVTTLEGLPIGLRNSRGSRAFRRSIPCSKRSSTSSRSSAGIATTA